MDKKYTLEDLEKALDNIPYQISLQNDKGEYLFVNNSLAHKLKVKKEDMLGKRPSDFLAENDWGFFNNTLDNDNTCTFSEVKSTTYEEWYDLYRSKFTNDDKDFIISASNELNMDMTRIYDNLYSINSEYSNDMLEYDNPNEKNPNHIVDKRSKNTIKLLCEDLKYKVKSDGISIYLLDNDLPKTDIYLECGETVTLDEKYIQNLLEKNKIKMDNVEVICHPIKYGSKTIGLMIFYYFHKYDIKFIATELINMICNKLGVFFENRSIRMQLIQASKENERIHAELAQESSKLEFFTSMSHEFRTPLNILLTSSQLMDIQLKNNEIENAMISLNYIKQNSYRLLKLTNNILNTTKLDFGIYQLGLENCNIVEVIEDIITSVVDYIKNFNKSIIFDTDVEEVILACDKDLIESIMLNLLSNALKYVNDNGTIEVKLSLDEENNQVVVSVWDEGISISRENAERIFERFKRIDNHLIRHCEGGGIGLSLTKSFVEMHKGRIWVNTEVESGTEIIFTLPINNVSVDQNTTAKHLDTNIEKCNIEFSDIYSLS